VYVCIYVCIESRAILISMSLSLGPELLKTSLFLLCSYQDPVLWVWLELFLLLRGTNSETTHHLLSIFLRFSTLKGTAKVPAAYLLRLNTLRGTKTAFLTAKRYDEHPRHFYIGVPPPGIQYVPSTQYS